MVVDAGKATSPAAAEADTRWLAGFNHLSMSVRSVEEAAEFWMKVFGARPHRTHEVRTSDGSMRQEVFEVDLRGVVLAFFEAPGLVSWDVEFPHYAFTTTAQKTLELKARLEQVGVATHSIWTRNRKEGLMYFRDPTGNLFELYCPDFCDHHPAELDANKPAGTYRPPVDGLRYEWDRSHLDTLD